MGREETMKFSLFFLPITLHSRSVLVAIIPISRSSLGPAFALLTCSVLASKLWENLWRGQPPSTQTKRAGGRWSAIGEMRHLADLLEVIFGTRDKNRTRKREFKRRTRVGFFSFRRSGCNTIPFSHQKGAIRGKWLFQILLTGSRTLNILFYYPIKSKNNHIKYTEHGLYKCSKFGPWLSFNVSTVSWISELESSQIIFATSDSTCYSRWQFLT